MKSLRLPALVLFVYAWVFPWLPGLRSPNELSRLYLARALVEERSVRLDAQIARHGPIGDLSVKDGHHYSSKAPGVSLLGAGVYAMARAVNGGRAPSEAAGIFWLRLVVCMVPGAVAAELLRRILARRFDPQLATAGAVVFGLGSIMWPYSVLLMSHGPTAAALVGCWWALERGPAGASAAERSRATQNAPLALSVAERSRRAGWFVLAGFLAGWAILLEYTSAIALLPLAVYGVARAEHPRWRAALAGIGGFLPPLIVLAAYHQAAFGSPFATGYSHLDNAVYTSWHARGFMGVGAPTLQALRGSFVDPARGLFAWAPFLALGVPGLFVLWKKDRALTLLCAAEVLLYAWFTTSFTYQSWGWTVGPRHIVTACAFLVPPALAAADRLRESGLGFIGAGLALLGMAVLALTSVVGPYLPDDLTNPVHQLVLPLVRRGFRSPDLLSLALHTRSWWTLLPWALAIGLAAVALVPLSSRRDHEPGAMQSALAGAMAALLFAGHSHLGGPDRFDDTRRFMREQFEQVGAQTSAPRRITVSG